MSNEEKHNLLWWTKTVGQVTLTTAITFAPEILKIFPEHTLAFKLALPIGFFLKMVAMRTEYGKDELPSGMTKMMDKIPDKITGEKGDLK